MNRFIRYYNQNRKKIWMAIGIVIALFILLKLINYISILNNQEKINNRSNEEKKNTNSISTNSTYTSTKSGVTGAKIQTSQLNNAQEVLDKFYVNCNNQNVEEAYNMLTDECKELVYPSLESFQNNYYNNVFQGKKKNYYFENWRDNTYLVTVKEDILSTGKTNSDDDKINDYVTIVDDKLNINKYIGRTLINKTQENKDIKMTVNSKDTFMDYEIYNLTIKNESNKEICLTSTQDSNEVYLQDSNKVKYGVYNHELLESRMIVNAGGSKNLSFKFYSAYVSNKNIDRLVFKNLFLDNRDRGNEDNIYEYNINF